MVKKWSRCVKGVRVVSVARKNDTYSRDAKVEKMVVIFVLSFKKTCPFGQSAIKFTKL